MGKTGMNNRKKVFITGCSSGIGMAVARHFAAQGWDVGLNARRENMLHELKAQFGSEGDHLVCAGDYSVGETYEAAGRQVERNWGGTLDAVVNCAGVAYPTSLIDTPLDAWKRAFNVMVDGGLLSTRFAARFMRQGGKIVHVTSIHDGRGERNTSAYGMAKAALGQLVRVGAIELAERGININAIAPGFVKTAMSVTDGVDETETEWFRANYQAGHHLPLRRAGEAHEIAPLAYFLAGDGANYITGQTFIVDGGLTVTF
jgi:NAD(P)-dependent dehydrogenase (short-subunit alcohol dehydrogenase family)